MLQATTRVYIPKGKSYVKRKPTEFNNKKKTEPYNSLTHTHTPLFWVFLQPQSPNNAIVIIPTLLDCKIVIIILLRGSFLFFFVSIFHFFFLPSNRCSLNQQRPPAFIEPFPGFGSLFFFLVTSNHPVELLRACYFLLLFVFFFLVFPSDNFIRLCNCDYIPNAPSN